MLWFLSAASAALLVWYVGAPFRAQNSPVAVEAAQRSQRLDVLEQRRESLLRDLKEMEFDHRIGKIDPSEYAELRAETAAQATAVLHQINELRGERRVRKAPVAVLNGARERLALGVEIEILVARMRRQSTLNASWRCECGRNMSHNDKFCASCGTPRTI
jgi:rRNA maturation endonuclease Nob1